MPAQTGLSQLGDALLRGSGDYANIQLRRQQEERQRAQQLADLADSRKYSEGQTTAGVERQKEMFTWQQKQARIRELIALGFLAEADAADEEKVAFADAAATARTSGAVRESDQADKEAKVYVNDLAQQAKDIQTEMKDTQQKLADIPDEPVPPSLKEIDMLAKRIAARDPKADYNNAVQRAQFQETARTQLEARARENHFYAQKKADNYRQILTGSRYRLEGINSQLSDFARRKVLPTIKPPSATQALEAPAQQRPAFREASAADKARAAGVVQQTDTNAPAPAPVLPNPMNNPALAAFQAQQEQQAVSDAKQNRTNQLANLLGVRDDARARGATAATTLQSPNLAVLNDPMIGMSSENYTPPQMRSTFPANLAGEISTAGQDELNAQNAYQKLLMQLRPLQPLKPIKTPPPASVFGLPDPYGAPIF